jgi:CMP-N-acetylneuraminic acid synthetase
MFKHRPVLALVPARGGSKGALKKNIRLIKGKPLVAYTIEAAIESSFVDKIYVSSDDEEILKIGTALGVEALRRPDIAATDTATADDVVSHFISSLPATLVDENPYVVYLQPTSPLRTAVHIDNAFKEIEAKAGEMAISVVQLSKTPFKAFTLGKEGLLELIFGDKFANANRQDLPLAYYPNGAIYIFPMAEFIKKGRFPSNGSVPFIMPETESLDIDSEEDIALLDKLWSDTNG